jgi:glycosyltransferase involved in cell wall biosynthesis
MRPQPARIAAFPPRLPSNPYCELLYDHVRRLGVDVVAGDSGLRFLWRARRRVAALHIHWPERHFRSGSFRSALAFAARLCAARALGHRLVWTVHNAHPHDDATRGARLVRRTLLRLARLVVHCESARAELGPAGAGAVVVPHGSYAGHYPNRIGRAAARGRLHLEPEARVFLALGQIRPYKGLDVLVRAFETLEDDAARLVVAGEPVTPAAVPVSDDPRIQVVPMRIGDDDLQVFLNAADVMVLPYRSVLTSGAAMLAFSFGRGVVAPRLGCLAELERSGAAILYDPAAPDGLAGALRQTLGADVGALGARARRLASAVSWETIARRHLAVYGLAPALHVVPRAEPAGARSRGASGQGPGARRADMPAAHRPQG